MFGALLALATFPFAAYLARYGIRHRDKMLWFLLGLVFAGFVVYLIVGQNPVGAICDSIHSFFPSRGDFKTVPIGKPCLNASDKWVWWQSIPYFLFHWLLLVYVLSIVLAFFGICLVNRIWIWLKFKRSENVNVFWDYSNEAWLMAHSMKDIDGRSSVVFALREGQTPWFSMKLSDAVHALTIEGWKWIYGTPGRVALLNNATRHFFLSPNGHENVAGAEALITMLGKQEITGRHIRVYVRVHSLATDDVVFRWADAWNKQKENHVEIVILREEAVVSRNFLLRHPMLDCLTPDSPKMPINTECATVEGDFRILLVGFGGQGKTLLNDMVCDAQYLNASRERIKISVDVVDRNISAYGEYSTNNDEAVRRYNMQFHHMNARGGRFWEWIHEQMKDGGWNRIVVCMRNDRENISVATEIGRYCKWLGKETKGILFARVRDPHINAYTKKAMEATTDGGFSVFGCIADTYRYEAIVDDKWDEGAMMLNFRWNGSPSDDTPKHKWETASCFNRESSRASFFFQRNMLRLLGYRVDESTSDVTSFNPADVASHLDVLAQTEHLRWMAWHFVRGIKPFSDDMVGKYPKANQIETRNAHGDLIDFDKLPNPEKKKDINLVASDAWQRSGLGIRRA